ncbi:hypothetical protein CAI21_11865 [Alkalilimnicola ehrlichii]|uniref:Peptidoglycan hydrolase FlgJ n=1 Tax=Alkalilimnicola ehrlichii TaxID=351052 RepID=A0A3E0WU94_9GAMM|nr:flagellar assembly peptidoglycan hydrolase FlgJ [Alkalilimnicola ehrlichii]RFA28557.1 hypothetical protein CAI21_11865 [Alkalilimnicola ehrlichii]RFA35721.1 hypothetical protein CAL65_12385 [Alkalilimnicola ehrlichii]
MSDYGNIFDTSAMMRLQADLQSNPSRETLQQVAQQFESLFVQTMLKSMRSTSMGDTLFGSSQEEQYRGLFDQQMSLQISQGQGLGLAPMIKRQLMENMGLEPDKPGEVDTSMERYLANRLPTPTQVQVAATPAGDAESSAVAAADNVEQKADAGERTLNFNQPEDFVRAVWSAAEKTARNLGVSARALVAQAALETGWGQHVMRRGDGDSSFNLFGIKAHRDWSGDTVNVPTLEYRNGVPEREMASFRAYRSIEESFQDYENFLRSNPRYRDALAVADDPEAYVRALQDAGYATDPNYADKITRIMNGGILNSAAPVGLR